MKKILLCWLIGLISSANLAAQESEYEKVFSETQGMITEKNYPLEVVKIGENEEARFYMQTLDYSGGRLSFLNIVGVSYDSFDGSVKVEYSDLKKLISDIEKHLQSMPQADKERSITTYFMLKGKAYISHTIDNEGDSKESSWRIVFNSIADKSTTYDDFSPILAKMKEMANQMEAIK